MLFYKCIEDHSRRYLFMVPATMRNEVLHCCHDIKSAGHPGISRTYFKLHQSAMWFGMKTDCIAYVKSCLQCNRQKKASRRCRASLGSFHAGAPVERIHLDILGPFTPSSSGNKYILMLVCQFTKWIDAYPIQDQTTERVVSAVVNNFILTIWVSSTDSYRSKEQFYICVVSSCMRSATSFQDSNHSVSPMFKRSSRAV